MPAAEASGPVEERGTVEATGVGASGFGSLETICGLLVLTWAAVLASFPLNDNSFFTHLATGRLILDEGRVPSTDPYTFTAAGEPWTVQSWLVSVVLGAGEQVGGAVGLRAVVLVLFLVAAGVLWALTRPATSILPRVLVVSLALFVVSPLWNPRPFMVGVIALGLVVLALDGRVPVVALVPLLWVWANSHGSFPLAFVLVVTTLVGRRLDHLPLHRAWRVLGAISLGTLLAPIGPLGLRVLTFPIKAVTRSGALTEIAEWQPPNFQSVGERAFFVLAVVTMLALIRRPRWSVALPAVVFLAAGLLAQRNIVMAVMVLTPVVASAVGPVGTLRGTDRPRLGVAFAGVCSVVLAGTGLLAATTPTNALVGHPDRAVAWLSATEVVDPARLGAQDRVGNLLEVLDGPDADVFVDDRVDMLPEQVFEDELVLVRGRPGWSEVLDLHDIDVVLWERQEPLGSLLAVSPDWRVVFSDRTWTIACRRGVGCASAGEPAIS